MIVSVRLQEWIYRLEEGGGAKFLRRFLAVAAFLGLAALYDSLCFRNLANPEAMDSAQLARNLAHGKGFTTSVVRPFSMKLVSDRRGDRSALLKEGHPDIANAPAYPLVLAPLMKVISSSRWLSQIKGSVFLPDLWIAFFNQVLLGLGTWLVFRLASEWFDRTVAWASAILFGLTELYWRFSISGLSTILLIDLVLILAWLLGRFERGQRDGASKSRLVSQAMLIGLATGTIFLTRYSMGWLLLPVLVFVLRCAAGNRTAIGLSLLFAFLLTVAPWVVRTTLLSGSPFGTAMFAVVEQTFMFPGDMLERSLSPVFAGPPGHRWQLVGMIVDKGMIHLREIIATEVPRMGGNWISAFFLAGLLVPFRNVNLNRLRWFLLGAMITLLPVQALIRTHLSEDIVQVNSENLLVVLSPLALIFGVAMFFVLFDALSLPTLAWRYSALAAALLIASSPLLIGFLPPHPRTEAPPYYPPRIQQVARFLDQNELLMSDIPWATAWYGDRQSVAMTLSWRKDFSAIHDFQKQVNGLYVSTRSTDSKFFSSWFGEQNRGWGGFFLSAFVKHEIFDFPLKHSPEELFSRGELLLMDHNRWGADRAEKKF